MPIADHNLIEIYGFTMMIDRCMGVNVSFLMLLPVCCLKLIDRRRCRKVLLRCCCNNN